MHPSTLLPILLSLLPLISADECVAGGPAPSVSSAKTCCLASYGIWYEYYAVQAICSLPPGYQSTKYQSCVQGLLELDTTCIPGSYGSGSDGTSLGVTGTATTTTTGTGVSTGWTTITATAERRA